ncbi:outer membrane beta-barrel protein [Flavobacterium tegetincola]|uniref:outer membrane beta-barrel protein n=1 Tax=Flavobacterium tegetincola TaxID=150172 RepID=UPI00041C7666|nr:outer membrane beta-barrel protein [Flavobacterium tegetincola]
MVKKLLLIITVLLSVNSYSQITFEKGYIIDHLNQKTECLIKNSDSKRNPVELEYRLSDESEIKTATIQNVQEFGIYNVFKYISATVNIDKSSNMLGSLNTTKDPLFTEEKLFLKVLVEGKANLFEYSDSNLIRFFYNTADGTLTQLTYKKYLTTDGQIATNNAFRQQLFSDLKCDAFKISTFETIEYKKRDLIRIFSQYSECSNVEVVDFRPNIKRDLFNLTFRPRINNSTFEMNGSSTSIYNVDFGSEIGFGFGIEAEYILPFNKNKWSIAIEPTYQNYKSQKRFTKIGFNAGSYEASIDYTSIDVPISLRHYFFLNNHSKLFLNVSYVLDLSAKSNIEFRRSDLLTENFKIEANKNYTVGLGYKLYDTFSVEFRYQTRDALGEYLLIGSSYATTSIILGYSIF